MRFSVASLSPLACIAAWLIQGVMAGAGASVHLCIWLDTEPVAPVNITWRTCTSGSHCMQCERNQEYSFNTTTSGLSCTDAFYVESKASSSGGDLCESDESFWEVVFYGDYSGQMTIQWLGFDTVRLTPGKNTWKTGICAGPGRCEGTNSSWSRGNVGSLWMVVFPTTPAT